MRTTDPAADSDNRGTCQGLQWQDLLEAVEDARIIGSVNGFLKDGRCNIGRLMVHPDFRGCGIGSLLLEAIEARFTDVCAWELFTGELSVKNMRLYEMHGYRIVRKEPFPGCRFDIVF